MKLYNFSLIYLNIVIFLINMCSTSKVLLKETELKRLKTINGNKIYKTEHTNTVQESSKTIKNDKNLLRTSQKQQKNILL